MRADHRRLHATSEDTQIGKAAWTGLLAHFSPKLTSLPIVIIASLKNAIDYRSNCRRRLDMLVVICSYHVLKDPLQTLCIK
jgi:hypothetical protein